MSDTFNDIGKRMPYQESEEYLSNLIEQATENAIQQHHLGNAATKRWGMIASAAAAVLLIIGIGITVLNNHSSQNDAVALQSGGPIDEFLNTLTDEEIAMLPCYEIEEIPEY